MEGAEVRERNFVCVFFCKFGRFWVIKIKERRKFHRFPSRIGIVLILIHSTILGRSERILKKLQLIIKKKGPGRHVKSTSLSMYAERFKRMQKNES